VVCGALIAAPVMLLYLRYAILCQSLYALNVSGAVIWRVRGSFSVPLVIFVCDPSSVRVLRIIRC
jgi:hypothetical protein